MTNNEIRFKTRVVNIGDVPLGGDYPVRVQSMTNTDTMDTKSTVEQAIRMIEKGCEYVRISVPGIKEAENLRNIKKELRKRGYKTPLIADIHFNPKIAEIAAKIVEKVRINPGNFFSPPLTPPPRGRGITTPPLTPPPGGRGITTPPLTPPPRGRGNDTPPIPPPSWGRGQGEGKELESISKHLKPLLKICKTEGTAIRIGVNHGSLSNRIIYRYGNTETGMVESALEFARICQDQGFTDLVLSLKASNTRTMINANRLLVERMKLEGMNYQIGRAHV